MASLRTPAVFNFTVYKAKLLDATFTYKDSTGALVNLTGWTAHFKMKDTSTKQTVIDLTTTLDAQGNGIVLGGAAGTVELIIKTAKTATFTPGDADYKLDLIQPNGEALPWLAGKASIDVQEAD